MNINEFAKFEEMIKFHLSDEDSQIEGSEIKENNLGVYLLVHYIVSDSYAEKENLWHKKRTLEILLKRKEGNEGSPILSYGRK
ncbi:hypothetical protein FDC64_11265 [Clostridium botulinum]|nr:hypothetical protein [Clostridium botulinum]MBY6773659.1 hypothetical protein [Clostridium botulinum]MBY6864233.1 hypothetical protein [Clostridium botulinum]MBY6984823.1 hypothetical protein [Clostridium botulinum]NFP26136.1 hypothetical protein [Clostridium botulinum]